MSGCKVRKCPPTGFQLHLSEQVKGYGVNKEYPTPTAKGDTCMKTKRYAQGGHPLTLVVGVEEGIIEPPKDYAWPTEKKGLWRTPDCDEHGGQPVEYLENMANGNFLRPTTGTQIQLTLADQARHSGLYPVQSRPQEGGATDEWRSA